MTCWQDIVIMVGCFGFALALIPSIIGKQKPARSSCLITMVLLAMISISFATLHFWLSFSAEMVALIAWSILFFQRRDK